MYSLMCLLVRDYFPVEYNWLIWTRVFSEHIQMRIFTCIRVYIVCESPFSCFQRLPIKTIVRKIFIRKLKNDKRIIFQTRTTLKQQNFNKKKKSSHRISKMNEKQSLDEKKTLQITGAKMKKKNKKRRESLRIKLLKPKQKSQNYM